jgi:hypothetical protein
VNPVTDVLPGKGCDGIWPVYFLIHPSTLIIRLNIVEEPKKPVILDDEGSAVMGNLGPFRLGQPLILVCLVEGGDPAPRVVWFRDGVVEDAEVDPSTYEDVLQNTLVISELDRDGIHQIVSGFLEQFRYMCPLLFSCVFPS